jgi:hypothetical protein
MKLLVIALAISAVCLAQTTPTQKSPVCIRSKVLASFDCNAG